MRFAHTVILLCPSFLLFLLAPAVDTATAGELSPALTVQMAENADRVPLTVLVVMRDGVDVKALDRSLHEQKVGLSLRHRTVIENLREAANSAQADLVTELSAAKSRGEILAYRAYWIINGVRLTADEATIRAIARRADVAIVEPDLHV